MNVTHDAVPMFGSARLSFAIFLHRYNFDFVSKPDENIHTGIGTRGLFPVRFHQQPPEMTLRACVGLLWVFA